MRVTPTVLMNQALLAMRTTLSLIAKNQGRLATGRQIQSPEDDPSSHAAATRLQAQIDATKQFARQAERARATLVANDAMLGRFQYVLGRVQELSISGADAAKSATDRGAMATEVDQLLEEVVTVANTQDENRYLLGGRETLTAPLTVTRNAAGQITAAAWNPRGVDAAIDVGIDKGVSVQTNVGGTSVLGADVDPTFLPALLVSLRDALSANDPNAVRGLIDSLQTAGARLSVPVADVGSRLKQVEQTLTDLATKEVAGQTALAAVLNADIARVATELNQQEVVYQASLHAAAKAIQPTLLDFLR